MKLLDTWKASTIEQSTAGSGPVVVLVDDLSADRYALVWAAAEAAARDAELRIVHTFRWLRILDPVGNPTVDLRARGVAARLVEAAEQHARQIAPSLLISTRLVRGRARSTLLHEARHEPGESLLVLGPDHRRLGRSLTRQLMHRTDAVVAVVGA